MNACLKTLLALILAIFFVSAAAHSKMYIWTDENGVKHVSNEPPPEGIVLDKTMDEIQFDEAEHKRLMREKQAKAAREEHKRQVEAQRKSAQAESQEQARPFWKIKEGMSKAEVLRLCRYPDLREAYEASDIGAFDTDWTYFLDNNQSVVVRFSTWANRSKVEKIFRQ